MGPFNWVRLTNAPTSLHYRSEGGLCRLILSTRPLGEIRYLFSESPESLLKKKETFLVIWIMFYAIIIEARTCTVTNWLQLLTVFSVFLQFSFALARFIKEEKIKDLKVRKGSPNNVSQILTTFTPPIIHLDPPQTEIQLPFISNHVCTPAWKFRTATKSYSILCSAKL